MEKILITASITGQSLENWITWRNPLGLTLHMLCINVLDLVLLQSNLMLKQSSKFAGTLQEQRITVSLSDQKGIPLNALWMLPMLVTGNNNLQWMIPQQLDHELDTSVICKMSYHLGFKTSDRDFPFNHWSWIHCLITCSMRGSTRSFTCEGGS